MRYLNFRFRNFKGITDLTLPLNGEVTTLIGLNESGKTTLLEAIYCFEYGAEDLDALDPDLASVHDYSRWIPIGLRADFNGEIIISAQVALEIADKIALQQHMAFNFDLTLTRTINTILIEEHYLFEGSKFKQKLLRWTLVIAGLKPKQRNVRTYSGKSKEWLAAVTFLAGRLPRIWYFPNFLFELPERFLISENADEEDPGDPAKAEIYDKDHFYKLVFENILRKIAPTATLESHIIERARSHQRADLRNLEAIMLAMSTSLSTMVFDGWNRILGGSSSTAQEARIGIQASPDGEVYLDLRIKGKDGYYDLSERSLGFRWFFMFLLMTSFLGEGSPTSKPLFLLDEPASNLHSSAQAELLKSFESLTGRCHLIYATHSHHLINIKWLDSAYIVKNDALGSLDIADYLSSITGSNTAITAIAYRRFVAEHPDQTSYFQPVLDLLQYQPSTLEPIPNIVLVEGKSDFYSLRYAAEILGVSCNVRTVPGTGAGSLDTLIQLYVGWGKGFLVLLDGDSEGIKQRERYEREFGPVIGHRCILLSEACADSKIVEVEDLFGPTDKKRLISEVYGDSDHRPGEKKALRNAIIELFAQQNKVPVTTATKQRFRSLFANLEQRLSTDGPSTPTD